VAYSYARRNQLARDKGFESYSDYRRQTEFASRDPNFRQFVGRVGGSDAANLDMARLHYQAFKVSPDDYGPNSAKARWLIDVAGYVRDLDEWRRRYPNNRRE
jgi:hypothetical protein